MPAEIFVAGPTKVEVNMSNSWVLLGYSDNDNLPSVQFTDYQHEVKTVLSGQAPEEIVLQGMVARIGLALVKWDAANLVALLTDQRGAAGTTSPVGRRIVNDTAYFGIRILSIANGSGYTFNYAYLQQDSVGDSQWGNRERVLTLAVNAIPNPTTGILYTLTAPSQPA